MSKPSCKCKPSQECEECPEWIFTFADLVMLMMGFFVILWVLKPPAGQKGDLVANEEWLKVVAAIREAFGYLPDPQSKDPVDIALLLKKVEQMKPLKGPGEGGETKVRPKGPEGSERENSSIRPGHWVAEGGRLRFEAGDARLSPRDQEALDQVVTIIRGHRTIILVRGHASLDDFPDGTPTQATMDLSLRRAAAVTDYLVAHGVRPEILRVLGCSTFEPVRERDYNTDGQAANRRVEVEATDVTIDERQDRSKPVATTIPSEPRPLPPNSSDFSH